MKESAINRTEYQKFLYSLFVKYGIESPDKSWSNSVWKVIVNSRLSNFALENFYKELSEFNIKNPSDENWTHVSHEELEEVEDMKKAAERKRIADAKKVEDMKKAAERKKIADAKKVEDMKKAAERKRIADAKKIESKNNLMKLCPSCKEEIKHNANKCKHCGEIQDTLESREKILQQKQESLGEESRKSWINWWSTIIAIVGTWFLLTSDWYWDLFF